jgi:hypothetical protein
MGTSHKKDPRQANQEIMIYSRIFIDSRSNFGNWKKTSRWRRAYLTRKDSRKEPFSLNFILERLSR